MAQMQNAQSGHDQFGHDNWIAERRITGVWFIAGHGLRALLERASLSAQSSLSGTKTRMEWLRTYALNLTIRFFVNAAAFSYWMHLRTQRRTRLDLWASQRTLHLSQITLRQQRSGFQAIV